MATQTTRDHDLFELFAEYSGSDVDEIRQMAAYYGNINLIEWAECGGTTWEERARQFYERADGYVFDLIQANRSRDNVRSIYERFGHWQWLVESGPEVLEFGGGLGLTCSLFRGLGRRVTYVDLDTVVSRFARWYFERTNQTDIEMWITPQEQLVLPEGRQWDFVFSDSVIEHVPDPAATVDRLAHAVRPGGTLYMIIDAHNVNADFPMHRHVYLQELLEGSELLRSMEHVKHDGDGLNAFRRPS